jgi:glycolate oxidase
MPELNQLNLEDLDALRGIVGADALFTDTDRLTRYSLDETGEQPGRADAVVLPADTAAVAAVLRHAWERRLPVTPRGAGTGLSGGALPASGGIVLSVERMNRILEIDHDNLVVRTETGIRTGDLQRRVEEEGLYYPPDPASRDSCLLAGNLAEDSAGPHSCKYGTTRKYVLGLEAVLADGTILRLGGRLRKDVTGYNLIQTLLGSEGTLAVITAATLRLIALPSRRMSLAVPFSTVERAAEAVCRLYGEGHEPSACEIMDATALETVGRMHTLPPPIAGAGAALFLEIDGDVAEDVERATLGLGETLQALQSAEPLVAVDAGDQDRLWRIRRAIAEAVRERSPYKEADTVAPRSELAHLVRTAHDVASRHGLVAACYGHAADGNLHVNLLQEGVDPDEWDSRRDAAERDLFTAVVAMGGSITGEHGIGWAQRQFMPLVFSAEALALQHRLKEAFDPRGILNPGKILP